MDIKTALVASAVALAAGTASAQISFTDTGDVSFTKLFNPDGGVFAPGAYTSGDLGYFTATSNGMFSLTYLGQESGYADGVTVVVNGATLNEANSIGSSISGPMTAGQFLSFKFFASGGDDVVNGVPSATHSNFALLGTNVKTSAGTFEYLIGYNDGAAHDDWDDYVVGLNALPIPEPSSYLLLLAGLGMIGVASQWRRRQP